MTHGVDISIVSHGHGNMVLGALERLEAVLGPLAGTCRVWLTVNLPEPDLEQGLAVRAWPFELKLLRNTAPLGFGANHNQAFAQASQYGARPWFLVMNPDIAWPELAHAFWQRLLQPGAFAVSVGLLCPVQVDIDGRRQDFARTLLTPWSLARRVLHRLLGFEPAGTVHTVEAADWVNGACMVFRHDAFAQLGGFDERYFMYCEDCDICLRLQLAGWQIAGAPVSVVHDARRATGRSSRHLGWHLRSLFKMWCSAAFWRFILRPKSGKTAA